MQRFTVKIGGKPTDVMAEYVVGDGEAEEVFHAALEQMFWDGIVPMTGRRAIGLEIGGFDINKAMKAAGEKAKDEEGDWIFTLAKVRWE